MATGMKLSDLGVQSVEVCANQCGVMFVIHAEALSVDTEKTLKH